MKPSAPIGIVGNGAIGNLLAWHCHQHALPYCLLPRHPEPLTLTITTLTGQQHQLEPDVFSLSDPPELSALILPLKAYQIQSALQSLPAGFSAKIPLLLLHNGMGTLRHTDMLRPENPVVVATTSMGAMKRNAQHCMLTGGGQSAAGWYRGESSHSALQQWINALLPGVVWHANIQQPLWDKLAVNAVINPLTAAYGIKNGELLAPQFSTEIDALCQETASVMQALGLEAQPEALVHRTREVCQNTAENQSSMLQDVLNHRPTELDYINGYLVEQARQHHIACPAHLAAIKRLSP